MAPKASIVIVTRTMLLSRRKISILSLPPTTLCITFSSLRLSRRPKISAKAVEIVMIPNAPIWMRIKITICPKSVKWLPMSTTLSPVTQVALVAVNRESMKEVFWPETEAVGIIKSTAPNTITSAKLSIKERDGLLEIARDSLPSKSLKSMYCKK